MGKKIKIIGAGLAGLSAGCYLQMNGYETEILEQHSIAGGLCTSWKRSGYTFDGCVHWLMGSGPGNAFHRLWSELLDLNETSFVNHAVRVSIEVKENADPHGNKVLHLYSNTVRLKEYLLEIAPQDRVSIEAFVDAIRYVQKYDLPPLVEKAPEARSLRDKIGMVSLLPLILFLNKWGSITNVVFANKLKSPFLREVFMLLFEGREFTMLAMIMQLACFDSECAGYPVNGSRAFIHKIEKRYQELGGKIRFNTRVQKIITANNSATGILTDNNETIDTDIVISAADWRFTVFDALEGKYTNATIRSIREQKALEVFDSALLISVGVARLFEGIPHLLRFPLENVLKLEDGTEIGRIEVHIYNYDRTMSPEGKTTVSVTLPTRNGGFWITLREKDPDTYRKIKENIASSIIDILDRKFGRIREHVEVFDVVTPATFHRYTGNWQGSIQGWLPSKKLFSKSPVKSTLPGLRNFYLIGHWLEPGGGLPIALLTARNTAQRICMNDKKQFACK